jgi:preprotein translocase subunit SecA
VLARIKKELARTFVPGTDFARLTREQEAELAALVIRICLQTGMSSRIAYGTAAEDRSSRKRRTIDPREVRQANPNDSCPCGSGRKFKSCCGRRPRL